MRWVGLFVAVGMVLVGCSNDSNVHGRTVEAQLADRLEREIGEPVQLECPDTVPSGKGKSFDCYFVESMGDRYDVRVTQVDDNGRYTWTLK